MIDKKYEKYISKVTDVTEVSLKSHKPGGDKLGPRYYLLWDDIVPDSDIRVLVRHVMKERVSSEYPDHVEKHVHDVSKAYVILSEDPGGLEEEVTLGDEKYVIKSPAAVFVPVGVEHHIKILKGHGFHIMIMPTKGTYNEHTFPVPQSSST